MPSCFNSKNLTLAILLTATAWSLPAAVITGNTIGAFTSVGSGFVLGQSVTTGVGGPWNNITFNMVDSTSNPYAFGTLFLLTQSYSGTSTNLNSGTTGFLASTSTISGGLWQFASNVTLQSNTQYFLYMGTEFDGSTTVRFAVNNPYAGGTIFQGSSISGYTPVLSADLLFSLQGTPTSDVPEPSSAALVLSCLGIVAWRSKRATKA